MGPPSSARARRPPCSFPPSRVTALQARLATCREPRYSGGDLRAFWGLLLALLVKFCVTCETCVLQKKQISPEKYTISIDFGKYKL